MMTDQTPPITVRIGEDLARQLRFLADLWHKPMEEVAWQLLLDGTTQLLEDEADINAAYGRWLQGEAARKTQLTTH